MYKAIKSFSDLQDNRHKYLVGDIFPRKGLSVSDERIAELSTNNNRRGEPMIAEVIEEKKKEEPKPKATTTAKKTTTTKKATSTKDKKNVK